MVYYTLHKIHTNEIEGNKNMNDINVTSLFYPVMIIVCLVMIYSNAKKNKLYKKENMEILYLLNEDDRTMRLASKLLLAFMVLSSGFVFIDTYKRMGIFSTEALTMIILPFALIALYIPLSTKTKVTTLGILKRQNLIRWDDIKGIDYIKPDIKGKQKVKLLYKTTYKDMSLELIFKKDDEQLELFKNTAKENRNKKKDKRIGKEK